MALTDHSVAKLSATCPRRRSSTFHSRASMSSDSSLRFFISWMLASLSRARRSSWNRGSRSISMKTLSHSSELLSSS